MPDGYRNGCTAMELTSPDRQFFFASDLHGRSTRYETLLSRIRLERPAAVFLGGDLLPSHMSVLAGGETAPREFITDHLIPAFSGLRAELGPEYPHIFLILGNDDPRAFEEEIERGASLGAWCYIHGRRSAVGPHPVFGYAFVPPTPFRLKDWERYDVSRFVDPGCVHPTEGWRSVPVAERDITLSTMRGDLEAIAPGEDLSGAIVLFHSPPYRTALDRAALDGQSVDHVPLDVHVGSIAIREFIERRQPLVTLHGHVHESAGITGSWKDAIGRTVMLGAAHDGPELALVRFSPGDPSSATRELL